MAFRFSLMPLGLAILRNRRRLADMLLLGCLYFVVASAAFNGFYGKWTLRDDDVKFSLPAMVDGTADRPYVYRQLLPALANGFEQLLPTSTTEALTRSLYREEGGMKSKLTSPHAADPRYALRYHFIYYGTFIILFAALFVMRDMCRTAGLGPLGATAAPAIFALFVPVLQTRGGYFYDFSEIFFMAAAVTAALRGRALWLIPLSVLGTWNKESFLFFVVTLYPLLRARMAARQAALTVAVLIVSAAATYVAVRIPFAENPGATVQVHLIGNLLYYIDPSNLLGRDVNYGIKTFSSYSVITLALIALVVARGWPGVSVRIQQHILVAAAINVPLFVLFCAPSEMRNLSMLYMGLVLLLAATVDQWFTRGPAPGVAGRRLP